MSADVYDLLYAEKDYRGEARAVTAVVRERVPAAATLLDVACGTAEHARFFADEGLAVDGIDLEPAFVTLARAKHPAGRFTEADMRGFDLGRRYDAVVCLFSSIGYLRNTAALGRAMRAMAAHLADPGVLVVEPWFEPGAMRDGFTTCLTVETEDRKVCRMSHTAVDERHSRLTFHYLTATEAGVRHDTEHHTLSLFTRTEMETAFADAGLAVTYDPEGPTGRGLYVATREA
jgi:SAM-dependent methyltransferase